MRLNNRLFLFFALCSFLTITAEKQEEFANVVTVYATKKSTDSFKLPLMNSILNSSQDNFGFANNFSKLFNFTPAVSVGGGARTTAQTLTIRGFSDESIVTLIDNRRNNFTSTHDGRTFLDPSILKKVEIVKSSSSAIYGGGAIGGIVAYETKDAIDLLNRGENFGVSLSSSWYSANKGLHLSGFIYGVTKNSDYLFNLTGRQNGNIDLGGEQPTLSAEDNIISLLAKYSYSFNNYHTLKTSYQYFRNDAQEPNNGSIIAEEEVDKDVIDTQLSFRYNYDDSKSKLDAHFYLVDSEVKERDLEGNAQQGRRQSRDLSTLGFNLDYQRLIKKAHTIFLGYEYYFDKQIGTNSFNPDGTRTGVPNAEAIYLGFYTQYEWITQNWTIIPALRLDIYNSSDDISNENESFNASPKLSISYTVTKNINIFSSYSRAFRAPTFSELYLRGVHFTNRAGNNLFIPNPELRAEIVNSFELGFSKAFDNNIKFKVAYFLNYGKDYIATTVNSNPNVNFGALAGTTETFNVSNAKIEGFEIQLSYKHKKKSIELSLARTSAKNRDTHKYIGMSSPLTFISQFRYQINDKSHLSFFSRYANDNDEEEDIEDHIPGFSVHDIYYNWYNKKFSVKLGVSNLFDKGYQPRFAGHFAEGRSYTIKLAYKF